MAAVLVAGVGTASATRLCGNPSCGSTGIYLDTTQIVSGLKEGTQLQLLTGLFTIECQNSSIVGRTAKEAGTPLSLQFSAVTFGGCGLQNGGECTITTVTLPTSPSLEATGEGNGVLSLKGEEVHFECGAINCTYAMVSAFEFEGANSASLSAQKALMKKTGGSCPLQAEIDASYTIAKPAPAYLAEIESQTFLCSSPSCVPSNYPDETVIAGALEKGDQFQLLTSLGTVKCESSSIVGQTAEEIGEALLALEVSELTFGECKLGETSCTVTTTMLPTLPALEATEEGNGALSLEGGEVLFKCGSLLNCTFATPPMQLEGANLASLIVNEVAPKFVKGSLCPGTSTFNVTYAVSEPTPAYLIGIEGQTLLCDVPSCVPTGVYFAETPIGAALEEGTQLQLLTNIGTVKCESSTITGKTVEAANEPLPLEISKLTLSECALGKTACMASATPPTSPSLEATGEGNGALSLEAGSMAFGCNPVLFCFFTTPTLQLSGGKPANLSAKEVPLKIVKGLCPEEAKLDATYTVSEPESVYVVN